jgi:hypothetical protein
MSGLTPADFAYPDAFPGAYPWQFLQPANACGKPVSVPRVPLRPQTVTTNNQNNTITENQKISITNNQKN